MEYDRKNFYYFIAGVGLGIGAMYYFDPRMGKRRRHLVKDKVTHYKAVAKRAVPRFTKDIQNRLRGAAIEAKKNYKEKVEEITALAENAFVPHAQRDRIPRKAA